ncbi:hypothetical protein V8G54_024809 [Vigna mungo]|uniref:Retrotransposon gag domain-containing protein n=1 Tax=Vigna mungo TaxID=3915 RepID=A0AAQ3N863_VIGMU
MASHSDAISHLGKKLEQILLFQANFSNTLHDIDVCTSLLESKICLSPSHSPSPCPRPLKFDLPSFNGEDALGTQIASFYLGGPALAWYQWMHNNNLITSWEAFLRALELRFAPSKFEDLVADLCKLSQTQSLQKYISEFESLANRISRYPLNFYLSCFVFGLKPHLRREVTALQPSDMPQIMAFAKLHDDKNKVSSPFSRFSRPPQTHITSTTAINPNPLPPLLPTPHPNYLSKDLQRRSFLLLTVVDDEESLDPLTNMVDPPNDTPLETGLISLTPSRVNEAPRRSRSMDP